MKKIFIHVIALAIIINPVFVLAQTANLTPPPTDGSAVGLTTALASTAPISLEKSKKITPPKPQDPPVYVGDTPFWASELIRKIDNLNAKFEKLAKAIENFGGGGGDHCPVYSYSPIYCPSGKITPNTLPNGCPGPGVCVDDKVICPISYAESPCPAGQTRSRKVVNGCEVPGECVPVPVPTTCAGGYELYGGLLCFNRLSGLVYKLKDGMETAISLVKYAAKEWGTSIGSCNGTIEPNPSVPPNGIVCKYASGGGDCGSWVKVAWSYVVSSCVKPEITKEQIEAARGIVNACTGATGQSSFRWSAGGVPELCLATGTAGGTGSGTGGGGTGGYAWDTAKTSCVAGLITARGETLAKAQVIANNFALCATSTGCPDLSPADKTDMGKYSAEGSSSQCWSSGGGTWTSGGGGGASCSSYTTQSACPSSCTWGVPSGSSGTAYCMYPTYSGGGSTSGYTSGGSTTCPGDIGTLLGSGCHMMYTKSDGTNRYCNSEMNKHVDGPQPNTVVDGCASFSAAGFGRTSLIAQLFRLFSR